MIYRHLFLSFLKNKPFTGRLVIFDKGYRHIVGTGKEVRMNILKDRFFKRVILHGDIGFGEAYMFREFETPDLYKLLLWFMQNKHLLPSLRRNVMVDKLLINWDAVKHRLEHLDNRNTKSGSRRNIQRHYDLSNEFYKLWLDKSMTYSSALFNDRESLYKAQQNKYQAICKKLGLKESHHVLEIGSGWGGFSHFAAKNYGCKITTITISDQQYAYIKNNPRNNVEVLFKDYRDITGTFDRIVSIEMMEALGHEFVPLFISKCASLLKKGGKICYQIITYPDKYFRHYLSESDFIKKYIFPGGELLSLHQIVRNLDQHNLRLTDVISFGHDYARTLHEWKNNFLRRKKSIRSLGFSDIFCRKWEYYFVYCQVGFATGHIDVKQLLIE